VQHCGLPTAKFSRTVSRHSVNLEIATDAAWLRKNYNKWEKSKLDSSMGMIDLIDVTHHYYHNLMHDFGGFVAGKFAPFLLEPHNFFASLSADVKVVGETSETHIANSYTKNGNKFNYHLVVPPSDLLKSFGITTKQSSTPPEPGRLISEGITS
jgi:hypothetical protein